MTLGAYDKIQGVDSHVLWLVLVSELSRKLVP